MQGWEYQPLGPFLAKSFATTISPWVVTLDALEPYRCASYVRPEGDPAPLPYLHDAADLARGAFGIRLEVWLECATMRAAGTPPTQLCGADFQSMYWTFAQMLTHHASNGCNLRPGDLLGSGTVSGPGATERGSMMELTLRGKTPVTLPSGESRAFLQDGDRVVLRGRCERDGAVRIGFGECSGEVIAAG
jgi:fumarylacetoacetase